ncbi:NudC domain-containing protein 3 [Triplophysa tibetana]|uniref:NudC domain-containing protein 3 n=1 Tax=Triplophysa tibetana TaxID=1572043 RepID=A0A5A9N5I2_9TELE|nr:NudC domain-containing protein 3 [Triplophysa tibetana]
MTELYDNALLGILQHVGNIQSFLQVYFGFLYRKTDFYRRLSGPNDRMGFPAGVAEKMVFKTFKLFEKHAEEDREKASRRLKECKSAPPVVQELEVQSEQEVEAPVEERSTEESTPVTTTASETDGETPHSSHAESTVDMKAPGDTTTADLDSSAAALGQETIQADPDSYNGAVRESYTWSQDYTDVEVRVHVQPDIIKGRQVSVDLQPGRVRVAVNERGSQRVLMEGEFTHKINTENTLWSLEPGKCVLLSLSKIGEVWWSAVLKGETEIDVNQINRERSMATVDEEEHAVLDRLTFDYHQKLQGKPQSHEMKVHDMLKKGWDAEGSPFKGQEFDPSVFNIPPSAVQF